MSRIADIQARMPAASATGPAATSRLAGLLERDLRGEEVDMPLVGRVWVALCPHDATNEIESRTFAEMKRVGLEATGATGLSYWLEQAKHTLAAAVREIDRITPVGSVAEWGRFDDDVLGACWQVYGDVRERLDPIGLSTITEEDIREIDAAIEKKNTAALRVCGAAKLSLYLLTTAGRRSISPPLPSSSGES